MQVTESSVVALNRAVAVAKVHGPAAGLDAIEPLKEEKAFRHYYLYYAVRGDFCAALKRREEAAENYRRALDLTEVEAERRFLRGRLEHGPRI
jgi:RNA polymerase sigma-70 factor (ECF subfamily)